MRLFAKHAAITAILATVFGVLGLMSRTGWQGSFTPNAEAAFRSTETVANALDLQTQKDKENNLVEIINELRNFNVYTVTGALSGSTIPVSGVSVTDTIDWILVQASCSIVDASTITGASNYRITWTSKLPGLMGNYIAVTLNQRTSSWTPTAGMADSIIIVTTGTQIEVWLATGTTTVNFSSAAEVVAAINADKQASQLVTAAITAGDGSSIVVPTGQSILSQGTAGQGTAQAFYFMDVRGATCTANGFRFERDRNITTANDRVHIGVHSR